MTKPKIPNQKKKNEELEKRLAKYSLLIEQIYDTLNREAAKAVGRTDYTADAEEPFKWSDYPETKKRIDDIQAQFVDDIGSTIYRSTSEEWQKSNVVQDLMATRVLRAYNAEVNGKKYKHFFQTNSAALKAFQKRKDKGMNLSAKLWKQADEYKCSLEAAISCAIEKGTSAVTLSKHISRYLVNFPELQKDYKERFGRATDVHDCEYNSMRLARTEINMAYREAENERWRQMDFVVGYEIKVSNNHGCKGVPKGQYHDICDELAGKYPKDFKWTGWHPQCRCYKIPILMTEDEFWEWDGRGEEPSGSVNEIKDVPDNFKRWAEKNSSRIAAAKKRGTLPYFVRDNEKTVETIVREKKLSVIEKRKVVNEVIIKENQIEVPPAIESYTKNGNFVFVSHYHGEEEYKSNFRIATFIGNKIKDNVYMLPLLDPSNEKLTALRKSLLPRGVYDGKNADFLILGKIFEAKSMLDIKNFNQLAVKRGIENRLKKAKKQADNIILEITSNIKRKYIDNTINNYLSRTSKDREIWVIWKNKLIKYRKK